MKHFLLALTATVISFGLLYAQPATMSYQGILETGGSPVNTPQNLTFSLHTALSGGTQEWTETQNAVPVTGGLYNVVLGSITPLAGVDFNVDLWLEVAVGATTLTPRTKLSGVPYAHTLRLPALLEESAAILFQATNTSASGRAVLGLAASTSGTNYGVWGQSQSTAGFGVYGEAAAASGPTFGVWGQSKSTNGFGITGLASATSGGTIGVRGDVNSPDGYAGFFTDGNGVYARGHDNDKPDLTLGGISSDDDDGRIFSDPAYTDSDLWLHSNDAVVVVLNNDNAGQTDADFTIEAFDGTNIFNVDEDGTVTITNDVIVSGTTVHTSDRNRKEGFEAVDVEAVLSAVARLPMLRWRYKGQAETHLGPMAQDFYAAFGLGQGETTISAVDADGVALAAIQGLHRQVQQKDDEIKTLTQRLEALEALVADLARQ